MVSMCSPLLCKHKLTQMAAMDLLIRVGILRWSSVLNKIVCGGPKGIM